MFRKFPAYGAAASSVAVLLTVAAPAGAAGTTTRISVSARGAQGNGESAFPKLSADGRHVAFQSWATNLIPGAAAAGVFVRALDTGALERVSATGTGAAISNNGRYVAFDSLAANLVPDDVPGPRATFVRDRRTARPPGSASRRTTSATRRR